LEQYASIASMSVSVSAIVHPFTHPRK